jgi:hypothetical protein
MGKSLLSWRIALNVAPLNDQQKYRRFAIRVAISVLPNPAASHATALDPNRATSAPVLTPCFCAPSRALRF